MQFGSRVTVDLSALAGNLSKRTHKQWTPNAASEWLIQTKRIRSPLVGKIFPEASPFWPCESGEVGVFVTAENPRHLLEPDEIVSIEEVQVKSPRPESYRRINGAAKKVWCLETGELFHGIAKASNAADVTDDRMRIAIRDGMTAGGRHYSFSPPEGKEDVLDLARSVSTYDANGLIHSPTPSANVDDRASDLQDHDGRDKGSGAVDQSGDGTSESGT